MQAKIIKSRFNDEPAVVLDESNGLWFEAEVTHPPSRAGKKLFVHLDQEMVTKCLLVLRDAAVRARQ